MTGGTVSLVSVLRDTLKLDYEAEHLDKNGHYYIYRYLAESAEFLRATMPSGAAAPIFRPLRRGDRVPIDGWCPVSRGLTPSGK